MCNRDNEYYSEVMVADAAEPRERARALISEALDHGSTALDEAASKTLLANYGVPVPSGILSKTEADAVAAAEVLGGRLVLKAVGPEVRHKTESGLVILGVEGPNAAAEAFRTLQKRAGDLFGSVLVERMASGNREFLVGMRRDPTFGPVLAFGLGGVLTEVLGDVALGLIPLNERDEAALLHLIRGRKLLDEFRGAPAVDRGELAKVFGAIARIARDFPEVVEIDINPLLIEGGRPIAADALVILGQETRPVAPTRRFPPDLRAVFSPASVAIVGASNDLHKWGGSALRNLLDGGYPGTIFPVNPRGGVFFGVSAYLSLADLPEAPELALMAVGGSQVKGVLEECGRRGVRAAVVLAAGFAETGEEGAELQRQIVQVANEYGITLIGPNCLGLMSNDSQLHATGFVALHPPKGKISFISQSGSMGPGVVDACERRGIGVEKFISVGNEAMVSAFDVLDYLADDPSTHCVMMYLEGIDDGRHFVDAARRVTMDKPVVVLRGGRTESGRKAAASHTAALAGSFAVFEAAARQAGVVTCDTTAELVDLGACLAYLPLPAGRRVAVVTNGGGPGVLAADEVALHGLDLVDLPPKLVGDLNKLLPPFWSKRNPMDLVAAGFGDTGLKAVELIAGCDAFDAVLALNFVGVPSTGGEERRLSAAGAYAEFTPWEQSFLRLVTSLMEQTGKPIINVPDHLVAVSEFQLGGRYVPIILPSSRSAANVLSRMAWYGSYERSRV
ncbi:MAG: acetate--CoA ligase family protein [Actinobacteria bacterium]|nr:acetate--CoA ligase family protein [Actinomycetota bacterium]